MKVALVCPYDLGLAGGVQQQVIELRDRLDGRGHGTWIVAPGVGEDWEAVGRTVVVPGNASRVPLALSPAVVSRVREAVADADVVHIHEPLMPVTSPAALLGDRPRVATFHAAPPRWVGPLYRMLDPVVGRAMRRSTITAVSRVAAAAIPPSWGDVAIVPNGIDAGAYVVDVPRAPARVAFLGRDDPRKGLDVLLRAWPRVRQAVPGAECIVLGATRNESIGGVRFAGRVTEETKREVLASSAVFVAPNLGGESFGVVLVEGMAAGCAVIASDLAAFRAVGDEAVEYVGVGDSDAFATRIAALLQDDARRSALSQRAKTRAQDFDWSVVLDRYLEAYDRARSVS